jgi:hypothetical protein
VIRSATCFLSSFGTLGQSNGQLRTIFTTGIRTRAAASNPGKIFQVCRHVRRRKGFYQYFATPSGRLRQGR